MRPAEIEKAWDRLSLAAKYHMPLNAPYDADVAALRDEMKVQARVIELMTDLDPDQARYAQEQAERELKGGSDG